MPAVGPKRSLRRSRRMSVVGGEAENICSVRVFRILTHLGHRRCNLMHNAILAGKIWPSALGVVRRKRVIHADQRSFEK
jgi:hypothetical protein